MEQLDLDIENYDLQDILNLFKIPEDFDFDDLKKAKQVVLKTHPDKSKLDSKYFLFFSKAYKTLHSIYTFKNKTQKKDNSENVKYESEITESIDTSNMNKELSEFFEKNKKLKKPQNFNKWFNEQFDKYKIQTEEDEIGYGEWLKSNEDCDEERNITQNELGSEIERKKRQVKDLVVHKDITELYFQGVNSSNLTGEAPKEFSSDLFSNLKYQDLRQAHRESVIPVTNDDYNKIKKFKNVDEYAVYRDSQKATPLSEKQALEYFKNKSKLTETESTQRAFLLAKQMEEAKKRNDLFMGTIRKITNF